MKGHSQAVLPLHHKADIGGRLPCCNRVSGRFVVPNQEQRRVHLLPFVFQQICVVFLSSNKHCDKQSYCRRVGWLGETTLWSTFLSSEQQHRLGSAIRSTIIVILLNLTADLDYCIFFTHPTFEHDDMVG